MLRIMVLAMAARTMRGFVAMPGVAGRLAQRTTPNLRVPAMMMSTVTDDSARQSGTVKWFSSEKGFGFIVPNDGGNDVFVHQTQIHAQGFRSLAEGEDVEFEVDIDPNGRPRAIAVTGPDGSFVQGAPRQPRRNDFDDF